MTHRPQPQADGHPGVIDRTAVALAVYALIAAAKEADVDLLTVLHVVADTWDADFADSPANQITS